MKTIFKSIISTVIDKMEKNGKVKNLTFQESAAIDHDLALGLKEIKNDFELKRNNSINYVSKIVIR